MSLLVRRIGIFIFFVHAWSTTGKKYSNWLSHFTEYRLVDLPIIPGTHNSATAKFKHTFGRTISPWARTQSLSIKQQLELGVRALDLRVHPYMFRDGVQISHSFDTSYTLDEALKEIKTFLHNHRSEFVILLLRFDHQYRFSKYKQFKADEQRKKILAIFKESDIQIADINSDSENLGKVTVKDLGGKVLLFSPRSATGSLFPIEGESIPRIAYSELKVVDIWNEKSMEIAKLKLRKHLRRKPLSLENNRKNLEVVAIDKWTWRSPGVSSPELNYWFLSLLEKNNLWITSFPLGVVEVDFVDEQIMNRFMKLVYAWKRLPKTYLKIKRKLKFQIR